MAHCQEVKIVVLGGGGVGKSALTIRLVTNNFQTDYDPTIEDSYRKQVVIDGEPVLLDILDTAGQEEFSSMQDQWMKEGMGFLLVYSITSRNTFDEAIMMREKIMRCKDEDIENIPIVIAGNKCDLEDHRQIARLEGEHLGEHMNVPFYETSAKYKINHEECFYQIVRDYRRMQKRNTEKKHSRHGFRINLSFMKPKKKAVELTQTKKSVKQQSVKENINQATEKQNDHNMNINVAIIGAHNVGKHSLIQNAINLRDSKQDQYTSVIRTKELQIGGENIDNDILGYCKTITLQLNVYCIEQNECQSCLMLPSSSTKSSDYHESKEYHESDDNISPPNVCNINDISQNNEAFLFICSVTKRKSLTQCVEFIESIKTQSDKPTLIAITRYDIAANEHVIQQNDLVEFALDYRLSFIQVTPETCKQPLDRIIACIRGYSTPTSLTKIKNIYKHSAAVWCMQQSTDGTYLYSGSMDGTIRIWDINTSNCVAILLYHTEQIYKIKECSIILSKEWCKPCTYLIACSGDCTCSVWLLHKDVCRKVDDDKNAVPHFENNPRFIFKHKKRIKSFEVCENHILCTVADDTQIRFWSLIDGTLLCDCAVGATLNQVAYVEEYGTIFVSSRNECIYTMHVKQALHAKHNLSKLSGGHHNNINEIRVCKINKDAIYLISVDESGYIRCWNTNEPQTKHTDFARHNDSINAISICRANANTTIACTASRDKTIRGYAIPNGDILFNINDSEDTLRAIDCNSQYVISGGKDTMVRCYQFFSNHIKYRMERSQIRNQMQISLQWSYQRHEGYLNRILCGEKVYKDIVFSGDRSGIILGWDLSENGKCVYCFGSEEYRESAVKSPKSEVRTEIITMLVQFMQLSTFAFSVPTINWGETNKKYNPFYFTSNIFQFDIQKYNLSFLNSFYANISIPFEWMISITCVSIFMILFCLSYKFKYLSYGDKFQSILSLFCWITMDIGFVPIVKNMFKAFTCNNMHSYLEEEECFTSITHWIYMMITFVILMVYLPTAYRLEYRSGDLSQINSYYWIKWSKDNPSQPLVHFASPRTNSLAAVDKTVVIVMIATSVFLVYGENAGDDVEISTYQDTQQLLIMDYIIICILLAASFVLCVAILIKPPFYFRNMNIFNAALFFGVFWTDLWSLFVINEEKVQQWSRLKRNRVDQMKAFGHLAVLLPFMLFGALLMRFRVQKDKYDEIRGEFRKTLHNKNLGIISEHIGNDMILQTQSLGDDIKNENKLMMDRLLTITRNTNDDHRDCKDMKLKQWLMSIDCADCYDIFETMSYSFDLLNDSDRNWTINDLYFVEDDNNRNKLFKEIQKLHNSDDELKKWLNSLNMVQYFDKFKNKGYTVEFMKISNQKWNINHLYFLEASIPYNHKVKLVKEIQILQNEKYFN